MGSEMCIRDRTMSSIVQALVSNRSETITTVSNLKVKDRRIGQSIAQRLCDYLVPVPKKIIVAVGGVFDVDSYNEKIELGADLVQLYTGLIYEGPNIVRRILNNGK